MIEGDKGQGTREEVQDKGWVKCEEKIMQTESLTSAGVIGFDMIRKDKLIVGP
jgi:hypothetical protein